MAGMTREQAQAWFASVLLDKIREDTYPSASQMDMVEEALAGMPQLLPEYMDILIEKVSQDTRPSIPMLHRIHRVAAALPSAH